MPSVSVFRLNSDPQILCIGVIYVAMTVVIFPVCALIIYALHVRIDLRENISYKLINLLNYCDLSQAVCHCLTGFFLIFPVFTDRIDVFVRIVGCTANSLWLASFVIMAILASTRIGIAFFKTKPTKWSPWMIISLVFGGSYIFFVWAVGCVTQNFQLVGPSWSYDMAVPFAEVFAQLELVLCFPTMILSFSSYVLIIYSIWLARDITRKTAASSIRMEMGILIQATVLTAYMAILITLWHNADVWFKMTNVTLATLNGVWILFSHLNALLLVTVNSGVRRQILKLICRNHLSRHTSRLSPLSRVSSNLQLAK
ncbi:unnamed protein product [Caenorhabditis sp. 36 PRJEB53466]|nr:unnamed protein product [Caenorhabditis sp. 36 PRJEB53466]